MKEGEQFPQVFWKGVLTLPRQLWRGFWTGEPIGIAWYSGPSWPSATLVSWTGRVCVGRSRCVHTLWARLIPRRFAWKTSPIHDVFVDPEYEVERDLSEEEAHEQGVMYARTIRPAIRPAVYTD